MLEVYDVKKGMDINMKKILLNALLIIGLLLLTACSGKDKFINTDEVTVNTILAKANGELQAAIVEDFDKPYYDINELKEFILKEVEAHNQRAGEGKVRLDEVKQKGNKAIMLMTYSGMDQYVAFNKVTAAYFNSGIENLKLSLPSTLKNASNDSVTNTDEVIKTEGYKVLVLNEPYEIIVEGKVKYYSDNAKLLEKDKISTTAEGLTVVVFK